MYILQTVMIQGTWGTPDKTLHWGTPDKTLHWELQIRHYIGELQIRHCIGELQIIKTLHLLIVRQLIANANSLSVIG